jgi:hypothetical protein
MRRILSKSARLHVPADTLTDDADLYAAGRSWLATVHLMLAIEDEFGIDIRPIPALAGRMPMHRIPEHDDRAAERTV